MAAFWNFIAFLVFGTAVANTVAATVKAPMVGLALATFVAWSLREAPNADTFAEEVGEEGFPLRPGAGSLIPSEGAAAAAERTPTPL